MSLKNDIKVAQTDLISELGIDKLSEKQQKELLLQISEVMQQRIVLRIVAELPEGKKEEFEKMLEENKENPDPVETFLKENLPNIEEMILEEIGKYKKEVEQFLNQTKEGKSENKG